jgi:hypothetical protein
MLACGVPVGLSKDPIEDAESIEEMLDLSLSLVKDTLGDLS